MAKAKMGSSAAKKPTGNAATTSFSGKGLDDAGTTSGSFGKNAPVKTGGKKGNMPPGKKGR